MDPKKAAHDTTIIYFHGAACYAYNYELFAELKAATPGARIVMPQADYVNFESGHVYTGWWDWPDTNAEEWTKKGFKIIDDELNRLPEGKRSYENIFVAGFSMGGSASLAPHAKWDKPTPLKGIFGASAYITFPLDHFA